MIAPNKNAVFPASKKSGKVTKGGIIDQPLEDESVFDEGMSSGERGNFVVEDVPKRNRTTLPRKHIMMSYQWGDQALVKEIRDILRNAVRLSTECVAICLSRLVYTYCDISVNVYVNNYVWLL